MTKNSTNLPIKPLKLHKSSSLQYVSDLELDKHGYDFHIPTSASILLLGGNTGRLIDYEEYRKFLAYCCAQFDYVLLVLGSRDFCKISHEEGLRYADALASDHRMYGKLKIMYRTRFDVPGSNLTVLGCALHAQLHPRQGEVPEDYQRISDWNLEVHNYHYDSDLSWLRESLYALHASNPKRKVVVLSHDAPASGITCPPGEKDLPFCSTAFEDLPKYERASTVDYWIFGHTGWNTKFHAERTVVLSNQRIVERERLSWWQRRTVFKAFDPKATITL